MLPNAASKLITRHLLGVIMALPFGKKKKLVMILLRDNKR